MLPSHSGLGNVLSLRRAHSHSALLPAMPPPNPHPQDTVVLLLKTNFMLPKKQTPTPGPELTLVCVGWGSEQVPHTGHVALGQASPPRVAGQRQPEPDLGQHQLLLDRLETGSAPMLTALRHPSWQLPEPASLPCIPPPSPFRPQKDSLWRSQVTC